MSRLSEGPLGRTLKITGFRASKEACLRLMEMGLCVRGEIQILGRLWGGNLIILSSSGKYTLRKQTARLIEVADTTQNTV